MIKETQEVLNLKIKELETKKIEKELLIKSKEDEKINLNGDRSEKQKVYNGCIKI